MPEVLLYWIIFINKGHPELMMIDSWKRSRWFIPRNLHEWGTNVV